MFDHIRSSNYDHNNCSHLACSEVRAAKLSGYCASSYSYLSVYSNQERNLERNKSCVRNKATEFMSIYYDHCSAKATNHVNSVIEKCFYDDSPVKDLSREKDFMKFI